MSKQENKQMPVALKMVLAPLGLVAFFGFIAASYFFGFMELRMEFSRDQAGIVNCLGIETRLFGLYKREFTAENVIKVGYSKTRDVHAGLNITPGHSVVLVTPKGDVPMSLVISNHGAWRKKAIILANEYLESREAGRVIRISERNGFGWAAVVMTGCIIFSYISYFFRQKKD